LERGGAGEGDGRVRRHGWRWPAALALADLTAAAAPPLPRVWGGEEAERGGQIEDSSGVWRECAFLPSQGVQLGTIESR